VASSRSADREAFFGDRQRADAIEFIVAGLIVAGRCMRSPSSLFAQFATEQTPPRHCHSITHAVIVTARPLEDIRSIGTIILVVLIMMLTGRL
jgi:hypothetical protein